MVNGAENGNGQYCQLYTNGADSEEKDAQKGLLVTGYMNSKLCLKIVNNA